MRSFNADNINLNTKGKAPMKFNNKRKSKYSPCYCLVCGDYLAYMLTNLHAEKHGYNSADEMIKDGKVRFD